MRYAKIMRKSKDKTLRFLAKLNIAAIGLAFLGISCFLTFSKRPTVSSIESRTLEEYPKFTFSGYFSGEFNSGVQTWFTDTSPYRDGFKGVVVHIKGLFGVDTSLKVYVKDGGDTSSEDQRPSGEVSDPFEDYSRPAVQSEEPSRPQEESSAEQPSEEEPSGEEPSEEEPSQPPLNEFGVVDGGLLILGDRCMEAFGGTYSSGQLYAKYVSNFKKDLGGDVNVYSMVIPSASSLYLTGDYYKTYGGEQIDKLKYINECFENTGVKVVEIYDILNSRKKEDIYYRTEHHWTPLGAYYAAKQLSLVAGTPFRELFVPGTGSIDEANYKYNGKFYSDGKPKPFLGSFYGETQSLVLKNNPETFFWYEYQGKYTFSQYKRDDYSKLIRTLDTCFLRISDDFISAWYMTYMDGDNYAVKIETDTPGGRVAVVFKDSFGNALVPMMLSSYTTIYAVDIRYFKLDPIDFIEKVGATDVLFSVSSFTALGVNYKYIEKMRVMNTQKFGD
ncbi:MAG: DHHW family protein [Eubacteriales bacterium]